MRKEEEKRDKLREKETKPTIFGGGVTHRSSDPSLATYAANHQCHSLSFRASEYPHSCLLKLNYKKHLETFVKVIMCLLKCWLRDQLWLLLFLDKRWKDTFGGGSDSIGNSIVKKDWASLGPILHPHRPDYSDSTCRQGGSIFKWIILLQIVSLLIISFGLHLIDDSLSAENHQVINPRTFRINTRLRQKIGLYYGQLEIVHVLISFGRRARRTTRSGARDVGTELALGLPRISPPISSKQWKMMEECT
ncbi:hypothetical protein KFK09_020591 [Dendrobium nobile]|uniref:Uncharacterized protein n=1 Tax=Dendrobium nobile TaxID=94219 RepID=A0A8T3AMW6_DENNO|nr:hypothetical protein KFK09_020591 [Dendrobium nobile]